MTLECPICNKVLVENMWDELTKNKEYYCCEKIWEIYYDEGWNEEDGEEWITCCLIEAKDNA